MIAHKTPHVKGKSGFFMDFSGKKAGAAARQPPPTMPTQPQPHPQPPQPLPLYGEAPHPQPLLPQQKMIRSAMMISHTHLSSKMLQRQLLFIPETSVSLIPRTNSSGSDSDALAHVSGRSPPSPAHPLIPYYSGGNILLLTFTHLLSSFR